MPRRLITATTSPSPSPSWATYVPWVQKQRRFSTDYGFWEGPLGQLESVVHEIAHSVVLGWKPYHATSDRVSDRLTETRMADEPGFLPPMARDLHEIWAMAAEIQYLLLAGVEGGKQRDGAQGGSIRSPRHLANEVNVTMPLTKAARLVSLARERPITQARALLIRDHLEYYRTRFEGGDWR